MTGATTQLGTDQILRLLDEAIDETNRHGRADLADRLALQREAVTSGAWHVLVAGEFKKGKSSLINAVLGVRVCGRDAVAFTTVPTMVRYAPSASAALVLDDGRRREIDPASAARYAVAETAAAEGQVAAIEVGLPRELLRSGLVLIDTPGVGGGFAAATAAATMRAMSLADAVLVVSDASQELTAAEVEFIRRAAEICPRLLLALTKIDLYPQWRRIAEIDRRHLRDAGLDLPILPVSSALREAALTSSDLALNAESGFPALVRRLRGQLASERETVTAHQVTQAVRSSLRQVADALTVEREALVRPAERGADLRRLDREHERIKRLGSASARWQHVINDRFADVQSRVEEDLLAGVRRLEQEATERIRSADPAREWATIVPWLYERTNETLVDTHQRMLDRIDEVASEVAALFAGEASDLGPLAAHGQQPPAAGAGFRLEQLRTRAPGRLELGMHAARGWSLSSSVITTLLVTTLHPGLLVVLPITAVLGTVFAVKAVHGVKAARLEAARNEAMRCIVGYLSHARTDANRAAMNLLRSSRGQIRDYYLDRANELAAAAQAERAAARRAAEVDSTGAVRRRVTETAADLAKVTDLIDAAERAGRRGPTAGVPG